MAISDLSAQPRTAVEQACAIPFRRRHNRLEFCLITSSQGRWIFPKGFIDPGSDARKTALNEAYEEAGLVGSIVGQPVGCFETAKESGVVTVIASPMEVRRSETNWPEMSWRKRRWVGRREAEELLSNPGLVECLRAAADRLCD
jgi:8-oxo-dGTP pyrophosphatase MutT (NUDIX family)